MSLDIARRACGGLLSRSCIHTGRRRPLADAIEGRHPYLVLGVGVEPSDTVAGGGDGVHRLVLAVGPFGSILDDVVRNWIWVARVPGDGHTGGCGLCDDGCAGGLRQGW